MRSVDRNFRKSQNRSWFQIWVRGTRFALLSVPAAAAAATAGASAHGATVNTFSFFQSAKLHTVLFAFAPAADADDGGGGGG